MQVIRINAWKSKDWMCLDFAMKALDFQHLKCDQYKFVSTFLNNSYLLINLITSLFDY